MSKVLLQVNSNAGQDFKSELYGCKRADEIRPFSVKTNMILLVRNVYLEIGLNVDASSQVFNANFT